jgi:orotidine-5'-phosphate decarboxylase
MGNIIGIERSLIPACDMATLEHLKMMVEVITGKAKFDPFEEMMSEHAITAEVTGTTRVPVRATPEGPTEREGFTDVIKAYKFGFDLGLGFGLDRVVGTVKELHPEAIAIYDHQKAGTDVPFTGKNFARRMRTSGIDAAIIFPRAQDPECQYAWTRYLQDEGIGVIVGGHLTHRKESPDAEGIFQRAFIQGVRDFVMPGTFPEKMMEYMLMLEKYAKPFDEHIVAYSPGLVDQGGDITRAGKAAGKYFHGISGRRCYNPENRKNPEDVTAREIYDSIKMQVQKLRAA